MRKLCAALCSVLVVACLIVKFSYAEKAKKADEKPVAAAKQDKAEKKSEKAEEKSEKAEEKSEKAEEKAEAKGEGEAPETLKFEKTGKLAPVTFQHAKHVERQKGCADCHEGEKPLFAQKRSEEGLKMADMYAGKTCGACHDGKKAFAAKGGCMKCHKK